MKCIVCFSLLSSVLAFAQPQQKIAFEEASIKPAELSDQHRIDVRMSADAGMLRYTNVSLQDCIRTAYRVKSFQIEAPGWIGNTRFDITAKLPEGSSQDQIPEMLQSLLADRFKLTVHKETKEHAIYALIVGKGGAKLKPAEIAPSDPGPSANRGGGVPRGSMTVTVDNEGAHLKAPSATLGGLGELISRFSERPIVDMTGMKGNYDFDLVFSPETLRGVQGLAGGGGGGARVAAGPGGEGGGGGPADGASDKAGSIYDSVQRYGLKLDPRKAPMEMIVVDHVEAKPTEN